MKEVKNGQDYTKGYFDYGRVMALREKQVNFKKFKWLSWCKRRILKVSFVISKFKKKRNDVEIDSTYVFKCII